MDRGPASGLTDALAAVAAAAEQVRAARGDGDVVGTGESAEGRIVARAVLPGRIENLALDPRVMRLDSQALAEQVTVAVNAALADLQSAAGSGLGGGADLSGLSTRLQELRTDAERQFGALTEALLQAQDRIVRSAGE